MKVNSKDANKSSSKQLLELLGVGIAFVLLSTALLTRKNQTVLDPHAYGSKGSLDFVQYWTTFQLIKEQKNPYDPQLVLERERLLGMPHDRPIMMWNPPWLPILMSPILSFRFSAAAQSWLVISILLYVFSAGLLCQASTTRCGSRTHVLTALFFFPFWENILWGQSSILMLVGLALFAYAISRNLFYLAGASLVLLSIKPHLISLFAIACIFWIVKEKKYQILSGLLVASLAVITPLLLHYPDSLWLWLNSMLGGRTSGSVSIFDWQVATLSNAVRSFLQMPNSAPPRWPMWAIPAVTCAVCSLYFFRKRSWTQQGSWVAVTAAISVVIAPYGWLYDQVLLLPLQLQLVDRNSGKGGSKLVLFAVVCLQIILLTSALSSGSAQEHFWWFPSALLAVFVVSQFDVFARSVNSLGRQNPRLG